MGFDRSKYKGANIDSMRKKRKEVEKKQFSGKSENTWHKIEPGKNVFRILPAHNAENLPFEEERKAFLKVETESYKDGEPTGKTEIRNKPVFVANFHHKDISGCPIETYIKYVYRSIYDAVQDEQERKKLLFPITGFQSKKGFVGGLRPSTSFVYYAIKDGVIGRISFSSVISNRMEELSFGAQEEDDPESIDIFSDPDEGVDLIVTYKPNGKKGEKYIVNKAEFSPKRFDNYEEFIASMRVSDEQLKAFSKLKPLIEIYRNVYTMKDFNMALDGLKRFDDENGYDIFDNDEFLDELEEIGEQVPEPKNESEDVDEEVEDIEEVKPEKVRKVRKVVEPEPEEDIEEEEEEDVEEEIDKMDVKSRLAALKAKKRK